MEIKYFNDSLLYMKYITQKTNIIFLGVRIMTIVRKKPYIPGK